MLTVNQQLNPDYYFIPYKFGCFSFQANADLTTMTKYNQVAVDGNSWVKIDHANFLSSLKERAMQAIRYIKLQFGSKNTDELIKYTYINFPYLAINSTIAKDILNQDEYQRILEAQPKYNDTGLYTIGYEGTSLEEYLNKLIKNNIKVLCDVRKNSC